MTGRRRQLAAVTAAVLLSLGVLALAWPRFHSAFRYLPVDIALDRYHADGDIPSERLAVLVGFARQAIRYHDHYRYHNGLSQLHYLQGLNPSTPALDRRPAYESAAQQAEISLQQAPAQPELWLRLATIGWILHEEPQDIVQAWKMSIFTGRTHSGLYTLRSEIGLAHRPYLDDEAVGMLRDQLLLAWKTRPGGLLPVLARRDPALYQATELLEARDPTALAEMETRLAKLR